MESATGKGLTQNEAEYDLPPKKEMYLVAGLSEKQLNLYKKISSQELPNEQKSLLNTLMFLRKVCNHPYLFEGEEDKDIPAGGDHLISVSGKMIILDKLLSKMFKEKNRVLIFTQMTRVMDILEDYCVLRKYNFCRIDGSTKVKDREEQVNEFNKPDSEKFIFLLSTRAGGLGLNLSTADTVILYDIDMNPRMDTQAIKMAYTVGQKNFVTVYRMITENTIEEKFIEMQLKEKSEKFQTTNQKFPLESLKELIKYKADEILATSSPRTKIDEEEDIDLLLERNEMKIYEIIKSRMNNGQSDQYEKED